MYIMSCPMPFVIISYAVRSSYEKQRVDQVLQAFLEIIAQIILILASDKFLNSFFLHIFKQIFKQIVLRCNYEKLNIYFLYQLHEKQSAQ